MEARHSGLLGLGLSLGILDEDEKIAKDVASIHDDTNVSVIDMDQFADADEENLEIISHDPNQAVPGSGKPHPTLRPNQSSRSSRPSSAARERSTFSVISTSTAPSHLVHSLSSSSILQPSQSVGLALHRPGYKPPHSRRKSPSHGSQGQFHDSLIEQSIPRRSKRHSIPDPASVDAMPQNSPKLDLSLMHISPAQHLREKKKKSIALRAFGIGSEKEPMSFGNDFDNDSGFKDSDIKSPTMNESPNILSSPTLPASPIIPSSPGDGGTSATSDMVTSNQPNPMFATSIALSVVIGLLLVGVASWAGITYRRRTKSKQRSGDGNEEGKLGGEGDDETFSASNIAEKGIKHRPKTLDSSKSITDFRPLSIFLSPPSPQSPSPLLSSSLNDSNTPNSHFQARISHLQTTDYHSFQDHQNLAWNQYVVNQPSNLYYSPDADNSIEEIHRRLYSTAYHQDNIPNESGDNYSNPYPGHRDTLRYSIGIELEPIEEESIRSSSTEPSIDYDHDTNDYNSRPQSTSSTTSTGSSMSNGTSNYTTASCRSSISDISTSTLSASLPETPRPSGFQIAHSTSTPLTDTMNTSIESLPATSYDMSDLTPSFIPFMNIKPESNQVDTGDLSHFASVEISLKDDEASQPSKSPSQSESRRRRARSQTVMNAKHVIVDMKPAVGRTMSLQPSKAMVESLRKLSGVVASDGIPPVPIPPVPELTLLQGNDVFTPRLASELSEVKDFRLQLDADGFHSEQVDSTLYSVSENPSPIGYDPLACATALAKSPTIEVLVETVRAVIIEGPDEVTSGISENNESTASVASANKIRRPDNGMKKVLFALDADNSGLILRKGSSFDHDLETGLGIGLERYDEEVKPVPRSRSFPSKLLSRIRSNSTSNPSASESKSTQSPPMPNKPKTRSKSKSRQSEMISGSHLRKAIRAMRGDEIPVSALPFPVASSTTVQSVTDTRAILFKESLNEKMMTDQLDEKTILKHARIERYLSDLESTRRPAVNQPEIEFDHSKSNTHSYDQEVQSQTHDDRYQDDSLGCLTIRRRSVDSDTSIKSDSTSEFEATESSGFAKHSRNSLTSLDSTTSRSSASYSSPSSSSSSSSVSQSGSRSGSSCESSSDGSAITPERPIHALSRLTGIEDDEEYDYGYVYGKDCEEDGFDDFDHYYLDRDTMDGDGQIEYEEERNTCGRMELQFDDSRRTMSYGSGLGLGIGLEEFPLPAAHLPHIRITSH